MITFFYDLLYTLPLAFTALFYYCGVFGVEESIASRILFVTAVLIILTLFPQLKLRGRLLLTGVTVAGAAGFVFALSKTEENLLSVLTGRLLPLLLIAVLSFIVGMLMAGIRVFRIVAAVLLAVGIGISLEFAPVPVKTGKLILAAFFLLAVTVAHEIHLRWARQGDTHEQKHLVFTAPFLLAAVLFAALFKYPDRPYDWRVFYNIWNEVSVVFDRVSFSFGNVQDSVMGFSDEGEIRSSVANSGVHVMEAEFAADIYAPVCFTGSVYDNFDGHRWTYSGETVDNARLMDVYESVIGARAGYDEDYRDLMREITVNLMYRRTKTKYVFVPLKTENLSTGISGVKFLENGGMTTFERYNPFRFEAREAFYVLNTDSPVFYDYMASDRKLTESDWNEYLPFSISRSSDDYSYDKYLAYSAKMEEMYLQPVSVSESLKEKLDAVYEGAASDYEKLKRLESTLSSMVYTTDTEPVPDWVEDPGDFLDYFLLDTGEGFCTHYATAFVLLARAEGLPSRYVQGYRLETDGAGSYTILSDYAHAWPEVYFKGKGWVRFEPTPGFNREISWSTSVKKTDRPEQASKGPDVFVTPEEQQTAVKGKAKINLTLIFVPLLGMIVFLLLFTVIVRALSKAGFDKLSEKEKLNRLSKEILSCLVSLGHVRNDNETLREFAERAHEDLGEHSEDFVRITERLVYSDLKEEPSDFELMSACHREVLFKLKQRNRLRYVIKTVFSRFW